MADNIEGTKNKRICALTAIHWTIQNYFQRRGKEIGGFSRDLKAGLDLQWLC